MSKPRFSLLFLTIFLSLVFPYAVTTVNTTELQQGDVIVLIGPTSVGKTSIIKGIVELQPDRKELGFDKTGAEKVFEFLESNSASFIPQEDYELLKEGLVPKTDHFHVHNAIAGGIYDFKNELSQEDRERIIIIAETLRTPTLEFAEMSGPRLGEIILEEANEFLERGKKVIFDFPDLETILTHKIRNKPLKTVLVYCPLLVLLNRIEIRNEQASQSGDDQERRGKWQGITQFSQFFRASIDSEDTIIDKIKYQDLEDALLFEERPADLKINKEDVLAQFGFQSSDPLDKVVFLTPRDNRYDLLINTDSRDSFPEIITAQAVQKIMNW